MNFQKVEVLVRKEKAKKFRLLMAKLTSDYERTIILNDPKQFNKIIFELLDCLPSINGRNGPELKIYYSKREYKLVSQIISPDEYEEKLREEMIKLKPVLKIKSEREIRKETRIFMFEKRKPVIDKIQAELEKLKIRPQSPICIRYMEFINYTLGLCGQIKFKVLKPKEQDPLKYGIICSVYRSIPAILNLKSADRDNFFFFACTEMNLVKKKEDFNVDSEYKRYRRDVLKNLLNSKKILTEPINAILNTYSPDSIHYQADDFKKWYALIDKNDF